MRFLLKIYIILIVFIAFSLFVFSCKKESYPPQVSTTNVISITRTSASSGGNVISDGGAEVKARGICWGTASNPTNTNSKTTNGTGTGSFVSQLTGLTPSTKYFIKAYATNSAGTAYGNEVSFTTNPIAVAILTTTSVTSITSTSAVTGGNISDDGGALILVRGICWSTATNPTTADSKTSDGTGPGSFVSNIIGLKGGTTYYVRAYATNSVGTAYGNEVSFKTTSNNAIVTTTAITGKTSNTAISGGNVSSDGGSPVTARGVCWATSANPTISASYTADGTGLGIFVSNLTGLNPNTTYFVRAYATNSVGTAYGNQISFTTNPDLSPGNFGWARQSGGTLNDQGISVSVDAFGNVYTVGNFNGTADFDPGNETFSLTSMGYTDIFISKLDALGNFLWAKQIGGTDYDIVHCIDVDVSGNIFATGYFKGTADFDPGTGSYNLTTHTSYSDVFILKLNANGNLIWAKQLGGTTEYEDGRAITVDASGNVYSIGEFKGTGDFDPGPSTYNLTSFSYNQNDIFISKLDPSGNFLWAKQLGGINSDFGYSISIDASGNVYTTGGFYGTADFDPGPGTFNLTSIGYADIFISKLDPSGNFLWAKHVMGTQDNFGYSICVDASGNIYIAGNFNETTDFDPGTGTHYLTAGYYPDGFILKLDASGNFLWAKQLGGTYKENIASMTIDVSGNVYTTGYFFGSGIPGLASVGDSDVFICKLNTDGSFLWAKQIGGISSDAGYDISVDALGNVYTTGQFARTADFDPGTGIYNLTSDGGSDIFIHKMNQDF